MRRHRRTHVHRYAVYDKIIHFGGGMAITAVAADLLFARMRKHGKPQPLRPTLTLAVGIALAVTAGWELYEYLGDRCFSTGRHAGWLDTTYDLIADTAGAIVACALLARIEPRRFAPTAAPAGRRCRLWPKVRVAAHRITTLPVAPHARRARFQCS